MATRRKPLSNEQIQNFIDDLSNDDESDGSSALDGGKKSLLICTYIFYSLGDIWFFVLAFFDYKNNIFWWNFILFRHVFFLECPKLSFLGISCLTLLFVMKTFKWLLQIIFGKRNRMKYSKFFGPVLIGRAEQP